MKEKEYSYNLTKIQKKLKKVLDEDRYNHTLGVMYTAASLAMRYDENMHLAQTAGLLHDCAKCIPNDRKLKLCIKYDLPMSGVERRSPYLLHAKLGAYLAREEYGVDHPGVLGAIEWHTTGKPDMTMLEKIIYLADYIEPGRQKAENLPQIRKMAFSDIDRAIYMTLRDSLIYLEKRGGEVDEMSRTAFEFYSELEQQKQQKEKEENGEKSI